MPQSTRFVPYPSAEAAYAARNAVDRAFGFPLGAQRLGPGPHVRPIETVALHVTYVRRNADTGQRCLQMTPEVEALHGQTWEGVLLDFSGVQEDDLHRINADWPPYL